MARTTVTRTTAPSRANIYDVTSLLNVTPDVSIPLQTDKAITGGAGGSVTHTRASVGWFPDDNGVYQAFASNVAGQNSNGIFVGPARINACTNYNAAPDASITNISASSGSVTRVDRTSELAAAGLANICPQYAFQYANTSGDTQTITITGTLGATTNAALSCWAKVTGGDAQMLLSVSGGGTQGLSESATFERYESDDISGTSASDQFQFSVPDGVTLEWVLNQLETDSEAGVSATWPIVTAGATGSRAVTVTSFSSDNIPTKNFVFYMEVTPISEYQMGGGAFLFDIYKDANNTYTWFGGRASNAQLKLRYNSTNYVANYSKFCAHNRKIAIAFRYSSVYGLTPFVAGQRGSMSFPYNLAVDVQGGTVYLGSTTYQNSLQFCGQIGNIKIFDGHYSDATIKELTDLYPDDLHDIGQYGVPFHSSATRIWALSYSGTAFDSVKYSDDGGDNWTLWHTLENPTLEPVVTLDSLGNVYYFTDATNYAQQNLYRIDATTKAETAEIAPSNTKNWSWQAWTWGETTTGTLYTSFYTLDGVDGQLIWVGTVSGTSWASSSVLINGVDRHVHSLAVDQTDDKGWVSWGDNTGTRGTAWSDDDFATVNEITDGVTNGPTAIAFTSEGVYTASDTVGGQNYVRSISDDTNSVTRWTSPQPFQLSPMYFMRSIQGTPNELWVATRNESIASNQLPAIFKITKPNGISSKWRVKKVILPDDPYQTGASVHILSWGINGTVPNGPYLYVYRIRVSTVNGSYPGIGVYRIKRA